MRHYITVARLDESGVGVNLLSNDSRETLLDPVNFKNVTRPSIVSLKNRAVSGNESEDGRKMFQYSEKEPATHDRKKHIQADRNIIITASRYSQTHPS